MAGVKPVCKYGSSCYRKNPQHLRAYSHPQTTTREKEQEEEDVSSKKNIGEKRHDYEEPLRKRTKFSKDKPLEVEIPPSDPKREPPGGMPKSETPKETLEIHTGPKEQSPINESDDIREIIHKLFLVKMPNDFYQFWDFCNELCPQAPSDALKPLGLMLTGPYDILAGKLRSQLWEECVVHGRHFFDPPELQTVVMDDNDEEGFHIGYFRDDPKSDSCLVVCNTVSSGCTVKVLGSNIFSSIKSLIQSGLAKGTSKSEPSLQELDSKLTKKAKSLGINIKCNKGGVKRNVVSKCFNQIGISVPVDEENDVGYRSLTMTNRELRSLLDKIVKDSTESSNERLQEQITFVQFANDECDYGMGLELGIDLFCHGDSAFHGKILRLLCLAYDLLDRPEYGKIIQQHLKHRHKPKFTLKTC